VPSWKAITIAALIVAMNTLVLGVLGPGYGRFTWTAFSTVYYPPPPNIPQITATASNCVSLNTADGRTPWSDANQARMPDGQSAQAQLGTVESAYLKCTGFDFSQLPPNAQIVGIEVLALRQASGSSLARDDEVRMLKAGIATPEIRGGAPIPNTWQVEAIGGFNDLWSDNWTVSDLQHPETGLLYSARRTTPTSVLVSVDALQLRVWYNLTPTVTATATATATTVPSVTITPSSTATFAATASPTRTATSVVAHTPTIAPTAPSGPQAALSNAATCNQTDYAYGTANWVNPTNAQTIGGGNASVDLTTSPTNHFASEYLRCVAYDVSAVPPGARILGIEVLVSRQATGANLARDASLQLTRSGTAVGTDQAQAAGQPFIPGAMTERVYGGPTNLWGTTWTRADLDNLGVLYATRRSTSTSSANVQVDAIRVRISYSV
jgi:hypothetical protein